MVNDTNISTNQRADLDSRKEDEIFSVINFYLIDTFPLYILLHIHFILKLFVIKACKSN